jgi:large subunit ribosomal protein L24
MKLKTGDKVQILSGKDKGKTGKVMQIFIAEGRVVVEGLNLMIKHQKPKKQGEKGQRIQFPSPVNSSNVALICPKCSKTTRIGSETIKPEDKTKKIIRNRTCKKCNEVI